MFVEICLAIITLSLVTLIVILIRIFLQARASIHQLKTNLNQISENSSRLLNTLDEFIKSDLHKVSNQTSDLIGQLSGLTSDVKNKSRALNCLFEPFSFLTSKMHPSSSSSDDSPSLCDALPQILKWIATSVYLIKTTKEARKL